MKKIVLISIIFSFLSSCHAFALSDSVMYKRIEGVAITAGDVYVAKPEKWTKLYDIPEHVGFSRELTPEIRDSLLAEINLRNDSVKKDSLMTSDIFYIFKPYFDWLRYIDPHYRVVNYCVMSTAEGKSRQQLVKDYRKKVSEIPFNLLNINDTLIVNTSLDSQFRKGDAILSINGIPTSELLKYNYTDVRTNPNLLLQNYFGRYLVGRYDLVLLRGRDTVRISTDGFRKGSHVLDVKLRQAESIDANMNTFSFGDTRIGYIPVNEFFWDNSRLIGIISKTLKRYKKEGIQDVVLDLRGNPGGYGDRFDELLSLFVKKDSILYMDGQRVISDGTVTDMPESEYYRYIKLDSTKYIGGIRYYVMMDRATGSVAATFCNMMQYNDAALLAGEPLLHNALKYGETVRSTRKFPNEDMPALFRETGISTVEFNEFTKAVDGVLKPDINIPYVAKDYMSGKDAMLETLLDLIKNK